MDILRKAAFKLGIADNSGDLRSEIEKRLNITGIHEHTFLMKLPLSKEERTPSRRSICAPCILSLGEETQISGWTVMILSGS